MSLVANRTAKALRLADAIRSISIWSSADEDMVDAVAGMPPRWWADIAEQAGTKPPSVETQQVVVTILRSEVREPDPFAAWA